MTEEPTAPRRPDLPPDAVPVRLRRAPRYGPFVLTGAVVGVLIGIVVALAFDGPQQGETFGTATIVRWFAAAFGLLGAVIGAVVVLLVERRRR